MALRQHTKGSNFEYILYGCGKVSEVDVSLKHDIMASFPPISDHEFPNLGPTWLVEWYQGAPIINP
jgi:hypothetical protein